MVHNSVHRCAQQERTHIWDQRSKPHPTPAVMISSRSMKSLMNRRKISLSVLSGLLVLWFSGLLDHLWESSFEDFRWPPYGVDVLAETRRAAVGKRMLVAVENDLRSFRHIEIPNCRHRNSSQKLLIVAKSSVSNSKEREAIRRTWGTSSGDTSIQTVFVVGTTTDSELEAELRIEIDKHGDVLYADSVDSYRNNTRKLIHSILFAFEPGNGCRSPEFLFLVDDDYMVNVAALRRYLSKEQHSLHMYEGWMFDTTPFRFRLHKHSVSLEHYPFDRYPPYISAGAVLMSRSTFTHFYYAMQLVRIYPFDDIYAGILAHLLRIEPRHNEAFVFWSRSIGADEWKRGDVLAAHGYSPEKLLSDFPQLHQRRHQ